MGDAHHSGGTGHRPSRALVLGGGMTGMLAASVLADHVDEVVIADRDRMPDGARPRKGLPQARHAHLLMSGGARAIESLLPGITERWLAAGARRIGMLTNFVSLSTQGWVPRVPTEHFTIACSRDLLDLVVRERVLEHPRITLREGTEVRALTGDARRVTGAELGRAGTGESEHLAADLVVDATGRGSQAPHWLARLGLPAVRETTVDSGLVYATRLFRAPPGCEDFPVVSVQAESGLPRPGQGVTLYPIEGGRWLVTVSGTRGGEPSGRAEEFEPFARGLRHPLAADLIAGAEPLTDVHLSRSTVNRRRYFERAASWPAGFVVMGDAVAAYNPVYGHGMSVAAMGASALRDTLRACQPTDARAARRAQRAVARTAEAAWTMAVGEDIRFPGAVGERPPVAARLVHGYFERMIRTSTVDPAVIRALVDVMTLSSPPAALFSPVTALRVLRGPGGRPLPGPTITAAELALAGPGPR
ncbi:pyridine nucleotide-disulfide oxidoreductase [Streptomyces sp. NRRL B-1568]|nr:pyridine nucleotide-disulfide oxidoreductase [Streptomyces sp. NRRL B-1568]